MGCRTFCRNPQYHAHSRVAKPACLQTRRHCRRRTAIVAAAQRDVDFRKQLPSAPPTQAPPPPPPPPTPPQAESGGFPTRRDLLLMMVGGSAIWWWRLNSGDDTAGKYMGMQKIGNLTWQFLKTKGGADVAVTLDPLTGCTIMFDQNYNMYYDTEDPDLGVFVVLTRGNDSGDVYNYFLGSDGVTQRKLVGNLRRDIKIVPIKNWGGITYKEGQLVFAFKDDKPDLALIPPNYDRLAFLRDGTVTDKPLMLDEGEINLERRRQFWPFGGGSDDGSIIPGGPLKKWSP